MKDPGGEHTEAGGVRLTMDPLWWSLNKPSELELQLRDETWSSGGLKTWWRWLRPVFTPRTPPVSVLCLNKPPVSAEKHTRCSPPSTLYSCVFTNQSFSQQKWNFLWVQERLREEPAKNFSQCVFGNSRHSRVFFLTRVFLWFWDKLESKCFSVLDVLTALSLFLILRNSLRRSLERRIIWTSTMSSARKHLILMFGKDMS